MHSTLTVLNLMFSDLCVYQPESHFNFVVVGVIAVGLEMMLGNVVKSSIYTTKTGNVFINHRIIVQQQHGVIIFMCRVSEICSIQKRLFNLVDG